VRGEDLAGIVKLLVGQHTVGADARRALNDGVIALVEVGGGCDVGREFVGIRPIGIDDHCQRHGNPHLVQRACEDHGGAPAEALAEDNHARLGGLLRGQHAVAVEIEGAAHQLPGEV